MIFANDRLTHNPQISRVGCRRRPTHPAVTAVLIGARETRHIDNALKAYEMGLDPDPRAEMSAWQ